MLGLSGLSVANYIKTSPLLMRFLRPVSNAYANSAGYRRLGLKYDDLLIEENETAQKVSERFGECVSQLEQWAKDFMRSP